MNYYYVIFEQKEFLKNQVLEEVLRERANYYISKNRLIDFWVLTSPDWLFNSEIATKLSKTSFYKKYNNSFYSVLISTDYEFINWIKLRIGDFENIENPNLNLLNYSINGLYGVLNNPNKLSILSSNLNYIDSNILEKQYNYLLKRKYLKLIKK
jgi:hypothetical protein